MRLFGSWIERGLITPAKLECAPSLSRANCMRSLTLALQCEFKTVFGNLFYCVSSGQAHVCDQVGWRVEGGLQQRAAPTSRRAGHSMPCSAFLLLCPTALPSRLTPTPPPRPLC